MGSISVIAAGLGANRALADLKRPRAGIGGASLGCALEDDSVQLEVVGVLLALPAHAQFGANGLRVSWLLAGLGEQYVAAL
jgi:hypothetical protein